MGTRHLSMALKNNVIQIAQYGQWDGCPDGQGATTLEFLQSGNVKTLEGKLDKIRFIDKNKQEEINALGEKWEKFHPLLSRDVGAEIFQSVVDCEDPIIWLANSIDFAADSLFCEWAYLLNFDTQELEIYKGFNKQKLAPEDRFYFLEKEVEGEYHPIKLLGKYKFSELPTLEKFIKDLDPDVESEDKF